MLPWSLCRLWQPDRAANAAQDTRSYTTARGTILGGRTMQSVTFKGRDFYDLDKQEFDWRSERPNITILRRHDEELRIDAPLTRYATAAEVVQRRLDYE